MHTARHTIVDQYLNTHNEHTERPAGTDITSFFLTETPAELLSTTLQRSCVDAWGRTAWNTTTTTTTAETHRAGPLPKQALQRRLPSVADQTSEPSSISSAVDDGNTNRVTKNQRSHPVKTQRKKPRISDNSCPQLRISNTFDACYERSGSATDYTVSLPNDNLTIDSILHSADQTTMEAGFQPSTAPIERRAGAHSILSQGAVNAAQLMQTFDVTSFLSASQLMQTFDMATFHFQNSGQLVEDPTFVQPSDNVLQNAGTPIQR
ncbi:hypothetical protein ASPFODRAFT_467176 [Aspergillus luchuensis CBS 106.47]|uniref:Uncharacterized protein n=1 Tax=Aspergillus luchuensis (strain CBS 106.47) TaxID=1137211 RepID=A0A1M3T010_ASPLC|nr:hypothetical protein ASPFODRAFT_467176 [Aspergillus luchuensis CBS 106.47]